MIFIRFFKERVTWQRWLPGFLLLQHLNECEWRLRAKEEIKHCILCSGFINTVINEKKDSLVLSFLNPPSDLELLKAGSQDTKVTLTATSPPLPCDSFYRGGNWGAGAVIHPKSNSTALWLGSKWSRLPVVSNVRLGNIFLFFFKKSLLFSFKSDTLKIQQHRIV